MILKGSQRGFGQNLAAHLMNAASNEHVELQELRGFCSHDLYGAFKEAEAVSLGTKCRQYLFSLSLSPPEQEHVPAAIFEDAIETIERRLGLEGQPRAIVFHEKEGRRHAHCVWSRIDAATMTARPMSFFKNRLMDVSRELYLEHGWQMPDGIWDTAKRDPANFTLAEWQRAKRQGIDPRWLKQSMQECWTISDSAAAFGQALKDRGFYLAKGDKRGFVILDHTGDVHSLPRMLGLKTKEVRDRLGENALPDVAEMKKLIAARMTPAIRRHIAESKNRFLKNSEALGSAKMEMTRRHREARQKLDERLKTECLAEAKERSRCLPKGLRGLWYRITGEYQKRRAEAEREAARTNEKYARERQALIDQQLDERRSLQTRFRDLRHEQAKQLLTLRAEVGRFTAMSSGRASQTANASPARNAPTLGLKLSR